MLLSNGAFAHEVLPSIADLTLTDDSVMINIRTSGEAILAGIDLSAIEDTNEDENSSAYDAMRSLQSREMAQQFTQAWSDVQNKIDLRDGAGQSLDIEFVSVEVDPVGNIDLPRFTNLSLRTDAPKPTAVTFGWDKDLGGVILRQQGVENGLTQFLQNGQRSDVITQDANIQKTGWATFAEYIPVGFTHIIPKGLDHILFVLGLFFFSTRFGPLIWQISAFTLAHTVTLAAGALGWVTVPASIVEPLIAASIAYVAIENIFTTKMSKWRPMVIFAFGLLHGLGFASVLGEFGLPQGQFIPALIGFNVGVEVGQLAVVAAAYLLVGLWFGQKSFYRPFIAIPASVMIAAVGLYWSVERVLG